MNTISPISSNAAAAYTPAVSNVTSNTLIDDSDDTDSVDSRKYTKFDHSATEAGTTTMSFSDFVDMVNPLQHIPVISSIYRAIENESINPVSRIVGDMLYSGPLGVVSVAMSGVGAIANSLMESQTGSDSTGTMFAALFGKGDDDTSATAPIQLASSDSPKAPDAVLVSQMPTPLLAAATLPAVIAKTDPQESAQPAETEELASVQTDKSDINTSGAIKIRQSPPSIMTPLTPPTAIAKSVPQPINPAPLKTEVAKAEVEDADSDSDSDADTSSTSPAPLANTGSKLLPLDRGSRTNRSTAANNIENQNRLISLSEGSHTMRVGHMIYTSPLMNGTKPMPGRSTLPPDDPNAATTSKTAGIAQAAPSSDAQTTATSATTSDATMPASTQSASQSSLLSAQSNPSAMPPALFDDVMVLKRLNQYKSFATAPVTNGATLDVTN